MNGILRLLIPVVNLLLYGHFWIAGAALAMNVQTRWLLTGQWKLTHLDGFICCGTLTLYALHRLVALRLHPPGTKEGRHRVLTDFRRHILLYAILASLFAAWFYWQLPLYLKTLLLAPCGIALAYVVPLRNGWRLRDLPYLKIFLIALAWAWITVAAPARESGLLYFWGTALMLVERCCFIFAITIPFDIRDLWLDQARDVSTLPSSFGIQRAKQVAWLSLIVAALAVGANYYLHFYSLSTLIALFLSLLSSAYFIHLTRTDRHDYFFTGLLDGTMVLQCALIALSALI